MLNYLFSLDFFRIALCGFSLLLLLFSSNASARDWYTNTRYKNIAVDGGFIICTKSGIEKLYKKRLSQVEARETITTQSPKVLELVSNEEGCYFENTEVVFLKIAEEYALEATEGFVSDEDGDEPCPSNPLKNCREVNAPPATYVEAEFLSKDGNWRGPVFIEMGGSFKLLDKPEDDEKE